MSKSTDRAPERQHGKQRDEAEQRPRQVIDAIRQVVLNPDADDVPVFSHFFANAAKILPRSANLQVEIFAVRLNLCQHPETLSVVLRFFSEWQSSRN
jgi:hypothetical protein